MKLQIIKSVDGKAEYVLLPIKVYESLNQEIKKQLATSEKSDEYVSFDVGDYIDNPIALARIKAKLTQEQLAKRMKVSQAYISKIECQEKVTAKLLDKVKVAIKKKV